MKQLKTFQEYAKENPVRIDDFNMQALINMLKDLKEAVEELQSAVYQISGGRIK